MLTPFKRIIIKSHQWLSRHIIFSHAILLGLSFVIMTAAYFYISPQVTGDEPHYLIADRAIAHYHTLDLKPVYLNQDYLAYYPGAGLQPQGDPALISMDKPHVYPMHGIGLPIFTLPGYIVGGKNGVVIQMILLAVAVLALTWLWCKRVTKKASMAYLATASLFICYFFIGLSGYIYPDMMIAAILLCSLLLVTGARYASTLSQTAIGFVLSLGIFIHYRNIVIALPVLGWLAYITWKNHRKVPWIAISITALFTGLFVFSQYKWFGVVNPAAPYGNLTTLSSQPLTNIVAMLFDSSRGILIYNPILFLLAIGLPLWFKLNRRHLLITLLLVGPTMGTLAFFSQWTGGAAPTGRYIMAFLPTLIPALAFAFTYLTSLWQRLLAALLAALTLGLTVDAIVDKFTFVRYDTYQGTSGLLQQAQTHFGINLEKILPSFTNATTELIGPLGPVKLGFWVILLSALGIYGYYLSRHSTLRKTHKRQRSS